jgi:DNA primase
MNNQNVFSSVAKFCNGNLKQNQDAISYLTNRGINLSTINLFEIGLFPEDLRDLFEVIDPKVLKNFGIIKNASYSFFKNHDIIFPIKNVFGEYIAFAGRTRLTEEQQKKISIPKYLNSIYKKSNHLFGLNLAKEQIIKTKTVYVVEGYFDMMMPYQNGLFNVVAVCGKFLSIRHVGLLSRYAKNIVLLFDNEPEAQAKAEEIAIQRKHRDINILVKNIYPNIEIKDIDEFIRKYSINDVYNKLNNVLVNDAYGYIKTLF